MNADQAVDGHDVACPDPAFSPRSSSTVAIRAPNSGSIEAASVVRAACEIGKARSGRCPASSPGWAMGSSLCPGPQQVPEFAIASRCRHSARPWLPRPQD
jgi:hypothetical protein